MIDFSLARTNMVDNQIRPNDVTDYEIIEAFAEVPREEFVSAAKKSLAYIDEDLQISAELPDRYMMDATTMAKLIQLARIGEDDIVLDVGCGGGYSTAVLSRICSSVIAVESDETLAAFANENLMRLGYDNAAVVHGPAEKGCDKEKPYDVIFVNGAVDLVPDMLTDQLKNGGRLVAVVGTGNAGRATLYTRYGDQVAQSNSFNAAIMPLPGFQGEPAFVF